MKRSRTRSVTGEASRSLATVQLPLPLLDILADTRTAPYRSDCLTSKRVSINTLG